MITAQAYRSVENASTGSVFDIDASGNYVTSADIFWHSVHVNENEYAVSPERGWTVVTVARHDGHPVSDVVRQDIAAMTAGTYAIAPALWDDGAEGTALLRKDDPLQAAVDGLVAQQRRADLAESNLRIANEKLADVRKQLGRYRGAVESARHAMLNSADGYDHLAERCERDGHVARTALYSGRAEAYRVAAGILAEREREGCRTTPGWSE